MTYNLLRATSCSVIKFRYQMIVNKPLMVNQPQVSKLIRELRLENGLTQEQFAATLGVTCSTMNRWENGRSNPSPLAMQKVKEMLRQMSKSPEATLRDRGKELLNKYFAVK